MTGIPLVIVIPRDFSVFSAGDHDHKRGVCNSAGDDNDVDSISDFGMSESARSLSSSASTRWLSYSTKEDHGAAHTGRAPPKRPQRHGSEKSIDLNSEDSDSTTSAGTTAGPVQAHTELLFSQPPPLRKTKSDNSPKLPRRSWKTCFGSGGDDLPALLSQKDLQLGSVPAVVKHHVPSRRRKSEPTSCPRRPLPRPSRSAMAAAMAA